MLKKLVCCLLGCLRLVGQDLEESVTTFSFALYSQINNPETNVVFSPYSVFTCIAMPYMGARGATAKAIESTLHSSMEPENFALSIASGIKEYTAASENEKGYQLNIANGLWIAQNFDILNSFREPIVQQFQAAVQTIDFSHPEVASAQINEWISLHTQGKIPHLLDKNDISLGTRLVLANAVYFKGSWVKPFDTSKTKLEPFWVDTNSSLETSMMEQTSHFPYYESDEFQIVALPFIGKGGKGPKISYVVLLPKDASQFPALEKSLSASDFRQWIDLLQNAKVHLKCPKFALNQHSNLQPMLSTLGMEVAFTPKANFSGIDGRRDLYINKALHQAFFSVDEAGVTAAAATAISMNVTSAHTPPTPTIEFIADHPFLFFLVDMNTKTPLFMGKLNAPDVNGS